MDQKYPCWMQHPNVQRPYVDRQDQRNNRGIRLGPIQVHSEDQRLQYEAQGYEVCEVPSSGQYQPEYGSGPQAIAAKPFAEYPKWLTPDVLVNSEAEEAAWRASQSAPTGDDMSAKRAAEAERQRARRARVKAEREAA